MGRSFRYAVAVLLGVIVVPAEGGGIYSFVEIARGDGLFGPSPFSQFQFDVGINGNGRVVFRGNLDLSSSTVSFAP